MLMQGKKLLVIKNNGISMVCESLGVEYMKLNDMLDEVLE